MGSGVAPLQIGEGREGGVGENGGNVGGGVLASGSSGSGLRAFPAGRRTRRSGVGRRSGEVDEATTIWGRR